jgi:hypothetical protein
MSSAQVDGLTNGPSAGEERTVSKLLIGAADGGAFCR